MYAGGDEQRTYVVGPRDVTKQVPLTSAVWGYPGPPWTGPEGRDAATAVAASMCHCRGSTITPAMEYGGIVAVFSHGGTTGKKRRSTGEAVQRCNRRKRGPTVQESHLSTL